MTAKTAIAPVPNLKLTKQLIRANRELANVPFKLMKVSPLCQREVRQAWIDKLVVEFDIDKIGVPEVSARDGYFFIMDGQHRIEACKRWLVQWEDQHLQCWVAHGLSEEQEAEISLSLNDRVAVDSFQKFKVAVRANRQAETEIAQIVTDEKLTISTQKIPGAVSAVSTLLKVHKRNGPDSLRRSLRLARDSYGDAGMQALVLDGFGLLCHRYNGVLDERRSVDSLAAARGGVNGLLNQAEQLRIKTGSSKAQCIAAVAVIIINRDRHTKKLQPWFKS